MSGAAAPAARAWPIAITGALLLFIVLMLFVAVVAVRTDPGRLEIHPYEKGLGYDAVLKAQRALAAHGWSAKVEVRGAAVSGKRTLWVEIVDAAGRPVSGLTGSFEVIRPADSGADRRGELRVTGTGSYEAEVDFTQPGLWLMRVTFDNSGERIILPEQWVSI